MRLVLYCICISGWLPQTYSLCFAQEIDRVQFTIQDDFETGELFAWEAYPYAQDIAFDALFFTRSTPTYKSSQYSIARSVKANDANELEHGFTKQLDFWVTSETALRCAIYFQSDRNPDKLELSLGTFDGRRFFHTLLSPKANEWLELAIPISEFHFEGEEMKAGEHIQVVTISGSYAVVSHLYTYTVLMDDFQVDGERQRRFLPSFPKASHFEQFGLSVLNKHFFDGDVIGLSVVPEGAVALSNVTGRLVDGSGDVLVSDVDFVAREGNWSNPSIYQVSDGDIPGEWRIGLTGKTLDGKDVAWEFQFLVPVKRVDTHPRLLFSTYELKSRIENESSSVAKRILHGALADTGFLQIDVDAIDEETDRTGEALVGPLYAKNSNGYDAFASWRNPMSTLGNIIQEGSFRYAFTGDSRAAEHAKSALLKLCSFSKWNNDWMVQRKFWTYYPIGYVMKAVAYGYDMLYDVLTVLERKLVRDAIMEKGLRYFYRDMVEMNRMPSHQTNHVAVICAGYGLAALAIYGDDDSLQNLEPYLSGIIAKTKKFMEYTYYDDGSYGEPTGYMDMASRSLAEFLPALERNLGINLTTTTNFGHFYEYPLYAAFENGLIQSYGDAVRKYTGFTQPHAQWLTYRLGNPYLYHYLKPYWEAGNGGYLGYLWYRDDIVPVSREALPTSRAFQAKGMVMRSGWGDSSTVITTRVGPNSNHYHYDQGSFQVMVNGEELLSDPGYGAEGYYANPEFLSYDIQAIAHNVMLVDHDPESQNPAHYDNGVAALRDWPQMAHVFNSEAVDAVTSDLRSVYKGKLDIYDRTLLYNKGRTLFLFDRVKSKSPNGEVFDWLFHAPKNSINERSIKVGGNRLTVEREASRLTMDVLYPPAAMGAEEPMGPAIVSASIRDRYDRKFPENFATFRSNRNQTELCFLAAMVPEARPPERDFGDKPTTELLKTDRWIGAKVTHANGKDYGFFKKDEAALDDVFSTVSGFGVSARRFMASYAVDGHLTRIYVEGTLFSAADIRIQSDHQITCTVELSDKVRTLCVDAGKPTTLLISQRLQPIELILNDRKMKKTDWAHRSIAGELVVKIPSGKHQLIIR